MPFLLKLVGAAIGAYVIKRIYFAAPTTSAGQALDSNIDSRTAKAVSAALTAVDLSRRNKKRLLGFSTTLTAAGFPIAGKLVKTHANMVN